MHAVEAMFKEYDTLRAEVLTSMNSRNSILSFGLASLSLILGGSIAASKGRCCPLLACLGLIFALPGISAFVLVLWISEYQRMHRAGTSIAGLEFKINQELGYKALTWETNLRSKKRHLKYPYETTVVFLIIISFTSFLLGLIMIEFEPWWKVPLIVAAMILHFWFCMRALGKLGNLRSEGSKEVAAIASGNHDGDGE